MRTIYPRGWNKGFDQNCEKTVEDEKRHLKKTGEHDGIKFESITTETSMQIRKQDI